MYGCPGTAAVYEGLICVFAERLLGEMAFDFDFFFVEGLCSLAILPLASSWEEHRPGCYYFLLDCWEWGDLVDPPDRTSVSRSQLTSGNHAYSEK